ncbi:MAG: hypothetical protein J6W64_00035 [Bacilli bacterium]|nr:hypothetical protein [Bacilli bacterium]
MYDALTSASAIIVSRAAVPSAELSKWIILELVNIVSFATNASTCVVTV